MIRLVVAFMGTARPRPIPATAVLIPTTRPWASASAPPELPGLSDGVGLDDVLDHPGRRAAAGGHAAAERADDAGGHAAGQPERVAHGDHELADAQLVGVAVLRRARAPPGRRGAPRGRTARRGRPRRPRAVVPSANAASPAVASPTTWALVTR